MKVRFIGFALIALLLLSAVSPTVLVPPRDISDPTTVFVIDHGTHTSLAIQADSVTLIRYAYGDKRYYAERDTSLSSGASALLIPTPAVLARAELEMVSSVDGLLEQLPVVVESVYELEVESSKANDLIRKLESIYLQSDQELISVPAYGLVFATHPSDYHLLNNSSTMIASWLREMGVVTVGWGLIASWGVAG